MFDLKGYYKNEREKVIDLEKVLDKINFSDEKHLSEMYKEIAFAVVTLIRFQKEKISTTQFRKFYDKVLELNNKAKNIQEEEFNVKIKPMLNLLYSKVTYSVTRRQAGNNFKKIMFKCLDNVNSKEELERFKLFLEAIVGFMPKK